MTIAVALVALVLSGSRHNSTSIVADTFCSLKTMMNVSGTVLDFDCLRNSTANTSSVKFLGRSATIGECEALCESYMYRGLPCRSVTFFALNYPRENFRRNCYGRVDTVAEFSVEDGAVSSVIDQNDCEDARQCELNGQCVDGLCRCEPGWRGKFCEVLDLRPAKNQNGYKRLNYSSWVRHLYV
jgi:hypothetical protein